MAGEFEAGKGLIPEGSRGGQLNPVDIWGSTVIERSRDAARPSDI
ncbi:Uncharacterised protein [Sphingobacterium mizutaii]|uniref:Uncharacterized protein n=1 Tax=Sphingobacterium mizutaii TaxID=1010 RepID=A0AAJ4XAB4_9SPHI|nr:hypothetical protein SAMN05192578_101197 [Sphingobacterium mizutaii]SNV46966.1 Uncharacterised protein [Sphingobacterium mizutaii]